MTDESKALRAGRDYLAAVTLQYWRTRRITILSPVAVPWGRGGRATPGPHVRRGRGGGEGDVVAVAGFREGVVTRLREQLYDPPGMSHRRMALSGASGSGKTTAMQLLLIDVLRHRARDEPVPVWLTCSEWDPQTTQLLTWVEITLLRDYPGLTDVEPSPQGVAWELVHNGCVALFLDGLDEMPLDARAKALELIAQEAPLMRVVLSSRPAELSAAFLAVPEESGTYRSWEVIQILPVDVPDAETFLLAGQSGERRRTWRHFVDHLRNNPQSIAARTFTSPLALSLAREAYADAGTEPADLLDGQAHPTPEAVLEHLLSHRFTVAGPNDRPGRVRRPVWVDRPPGPIRALLRRATGLRRAIDSGRAIASGCRDLAHRWATRGETRENRSMLYGYALMFVIAAGVGGGILVGLASTPGHGIAVGIKVGLAFALAVAFVIGTLYWAVALEQIFSNSRTYYSSRDGEACGGGRWCSHRSWPPGRAPGA